MARSTLPPSQQSAGLIPPYRPSPSSTISSTWMESGYPPNFTPQEPPRSRLRDYSNSSTQSPSSAKQPNALSSSTTRPFTANAVNSGSSHSKLHKKSGSASTTPNLASKNSYDTFNELETDLNAQAYSRRTDRSTTSPSPTSAERSRAKASIKPLLRRLTPQESNSLDLSRSAAENEGLGIYTSVDRERRIGEPISASVDRRGPFHNRSTSGTSQFSTNTNSSGQKPGSVYVHPMRQTPRPYTPPASIIGSDHSAEVGRPGPESEHSHGPSAGDRSTSFNSIHSPQSTLRLHTNSLTRLATSSQTNLAGTPTSFRGAESTSMADAASPISRSSFDRGFRMRSRTNTDPISRAASIQAARRAFEEKEAAKTRKIEKQQLKVLDREARRREKQSPTLNPVEPREKTAFDDPVDNELDEPTRSIDHGTLPREGKAEYIDATRDPDQGPRVKGTKSTWVLFLTWLRTRIFKLKRKVSHTSVH